MLDGPFYIAWADATESTFGAEHMRVDEDVFDFNISQSEGDFATLTVTVRNPKVGLLAAGRKFWLWFAYNKAFDPTASEASLSDVEPLFFGRLVGMPDDLSGETVSLSFIARPEDFVAQKETVAATKREAPYWDPIWFTPDTLDDPDHVLESRPELWHINRTTLEVTTSNITNGEDGTLTFDEDNVFYDTVKVSYNGSPLRTVNVTASVSWDQKASGVVHFNRDISGHGLFYSIRTYTGDQLLENWPKEGASFGGGWNVGPTTIERLDSNKAQWIYGNNITFVAQWSGKNSIVPSWAFEQSLGNFHYPAHILRIPQQNLIGTLSAAYDVSRNRSETLTFSLSADVQSVLTEPDDGASVALNFTSSEIASPIDPGGALPIGKVLRRTFFPTRRGTQSIEYLIALARAKLLASARCVRVSFEISLTDAINAGVSLRKSAVLQDSRMPGGIAGGKIIEYQMSGNGDSGEFKCELTLACSVGKGGTVEPVDGTPTYVEEGYVEKGWQRYQGQFVLPDAGDVGYESIEGLPALDDGFDFENLSSEAIVKSVTKTNTWIEQEAFIPRAADRPEDVFAILNDHPCTWQVDLKPLGSGPFASGFQTLCTDLKIPKTIDLEAVVSS